MAVGRPVDSIGEPSESKRPGRVPRAGRRSQPKLEDTGFLTRELRHESSWKQGAADPWYALDPESRRLVRLAESEVWKVPEVSREHPSDDHL